MNKGLLDFLQSASNAVASNVSGPIDLIGMGLNKIGVPVGAAPVGGTDWMKSKGLMRDVEQGPARVLGETAGLLGPALASKFAPQIAKGLLQGGENLAAPARLNKEAGAIVWHGSPHKFDKFDSSKIGTGEGAQAYGHGLYLAESPDVAKGYQASTTKGFGLPDGQSVQGVANIIALRGEAAARKAYANLGGQLDDVIAQAKQAIDGNSSLYKVDLPDEHIAKMLDWDKPLSQQAPDVQKALNSEQVKGMIAKLKANGQLGDYSADDLAKFKGEDWHDFIRQASGDSNVAPSEFLRQQGIPGIRYLDGGSRGTGQGTSNFVVFPGNEGLLSILERNGQAIK